MPSFARSSSVRGRWDVRAGYVHVVARLRSSGRTRSGPRVRKAPAPPPVSRTAGRRPARRLRARTTACPRSHRARASGPGRAADGPAIRDSARALPRIAPPGKRASSRALAEWRSMRKASVRTPRSASQASNGTEVEPDAHGLGARGLHERARPDEDAGGDVAVARQVLGRAVVHGGGSVLEGPEERRGREGAVHEEAQAPSSRDSARPGRSASRSSGLETASTKIARVASVMAARRRPVPWCRRRSRGFPTAPPARVAGRRVVPYRSCPATR